MIHYKCQYCGADMESPDSMAGQEEVCPSCGSAVTIPEEQASENEVGEVSYAMDVMARHFLSLSGAFYDKYENAHEALTGKAREPDNASLFEAMAFFLFVCDFEMFYSKQSKATQDYISSTLEYLTTTAFSNDKGISMGTPEVIAEAIMNRQEYYSRFVNERKPKEPLGLFFGSFNPVVNNMCAFRGSSVISNEDAPIVIGDFFEKLAEHSLLVDVYLQTACPFQMALRNLFANNENAFLLSRSEVDSRVQAAFESAEKVRQKMVSS